jgi:hypothetical protein
MGYGDLACVILLFLFELFIFYICVVKFSFVGADIGLSVGQAADWTVQVLFLTGPWLSHLDLL